MGSDTQLSKAALSHEVELSRVRGISTSYQLTASGDRKLEVRDETYLNSLTGIVSREGYITLTNVGQALNALARLDRTPEFIVDTNRHLVQTDPYNGPAGIRGDQLYLDATPHKNFKIGFTPEYEIFHDDLAKRKELRIQLRKAIWHEVMEITLIAINNLVFNNPEGISRLGIANAFANQHVKGKLDLASTSNFFPWPGDTDLPTRESPDTTPLFWLASEEPVKELKINYNNRDGSQCRVEILDYKSRKVNEIMIPVGKGAVTWGANQSPGEYHLKISQGSQTFLKQFKLLPPQSILWNARVDFGAGDRFFLIEPATGVRWPINKGFGFSLYKERDQLGYVNVRQDRTDRLLLKPREPSSLQYGQTYTLWAYAEDPFLKELFKKQTDIHIQWRRDVALTY